MIQAHKTDFYVLKRKRGEWVLSVLCGGIGQYERTLVLTTEEVARVEEWGRYYVEKLALDVAKEPSLFGARLK